MYQTLFNYIERYGKIALSNEEKLLIQASIEPIKLKKKQYFLKENTICEYAGFVIKGALRLFTVDENGSENTLQFNIEDWWAVDMNSYLNQTPSPCYIEAREDSELLAVPRKNFEEIIKIPTFQAMFWNINQNHHIASQKRRDEANNLSVAQRYDNFALRYPEIIQRFPLSQLASYFGIARETLSRIRKKS